MLKVPGKRQRLRDSGSRALDLYKVQIATFEDVFLIRFKFNLNGKNKMEARFDLMGNFQTFSRDIFNGANLGGRDPYTLKIFHTNHFWNSFGVDLRKWGNLYLRNYMGRRIW